jgi:hypothetical protein
MTMIRYLTLILTVVLAAPTLFAQRLPDINSYLYMVEHGQTEKVRDLLPGLVEQYPNDPGVLYLQAILNTDGSAAVKMYQSIVDNYPKSEWADDALFKVYQFYYSLGLYRTAELKLAQLKKEYPSSRYLSQSAEVETEQLPEEETPLSPVETPVQSQEGEGQFTLQVGAFSTQVNAEKQKLFFEDLNMPVEVINRVKDGRSLYIVLVGRFKTADDARAQGTEIKKNYNMESMVVTR